jgi:hypothetical protein
VKDLPNLKLRPETIERLRATAAAFGLSIDDLGDRIIAEMLPAFEREDLIATAPEAS